METEQKADFTFHKSERLCSKRIIEKLFSGGNKSFSAYPVRVVYTPIEDDEPHVSVLISVAKRRFKRAVKRNRVKRQIREAYRKNKHLLINHLENQNMKGMALAFLWLSDRLYSSNEVENCIKQLLIKIAEQTSTFSTHQKSDYDAE